MQARRRELHRHLLRARRRRAACKGALTAATPARITIVVFAGGAATRLPGKLALTVDGEPMLVRVCRRLRESGLPLIVSARAPLDEALASSLGVPAVLDAFEDAGPLGGLVTAARAVTTPLLFAAAGDMPGIDAAFVRELEAEYERQSSAGTPPEAVVPERDGGLLEPLAALYDARAVAASGARALAAGRRKVTAALEGLRVARVRFGPEHDARLANVNTPADYSTYGGNDRDGRP